MPCFKKPPYFDKPPHFDGKARNYCFLEELHVYHKYYRQGIGTALTMKAIEYARSRKANAIYTLEDNYNIPARKTYTKYGFKEHSGLTRFKLDLS